MCTLIIGRDVVAPGTLALAANRDEDPRRPSDPPRVLLAAPRVVGGRDRVAGGSWLVVRDGRAVVAILNRGGVPAVSGVRSRGLLALDVAAAVGAADPAGADPPPLRPGGLSGAALARAWGEASSGCFAPFSLVFASLPSCWVLSLRRDAPPSVEEIPAGWHVLTHADLDDPDEPRTSWLRRGLADWRPADAAEAERGLIARLRHHAGEAGNRATPAVCIHEGGARTVSAAVVWLDPTGARYRHAEGPPCERPFDDYSHLLAGDRPAPETT